MGNTYDTHYHQACINQQAEMLADLRRYRARAKQDKLRIAELEAERDRYWEALKRVRSLPSGLMFSGADIRTLTTLEGERG